MNESDKGKTNTMIAQSGCELKFNLGTRIIIPRLVTNLSMGQSRRAVEEITTYPPGSYRPIILLAERRDMLSGGSVPPLRPTEIYTPSIDGFAP